MERIYELMESEFGLSQEMLDPESFTEDFAVYNSDLGVFEVYESQPLDTEDTFPSRRCQGSRKRSGGSHGSTKKQRQSRQQKYLYFPGVHR